MEVEKRQPAVTWIPMVAVVISVASLTASLMAFGFSVRSERQMMLEVVNLREKVDQLNLKVELFEAEKLQKDVAVEKSAVAMTESDVEKRSYQPDYVTMEEVLMSVNNTLGTHLVSMINRCTDRIDEVEEEVSTSGGGGGSGGSQYIRWGRTTCPDSSQLIYEGFVGGQHYSHRGGASDRVCLPLEPEYNRYTSAAENSNFIYGAEYQLEGTADKIFPRNVHDDNVPCATCLTPGRSVSMMIPAKRTCPDETWTKEYEGYLMTSHYGHFRTTYSCVDADPETIVGEQANTDGALFYFVQTECATLRHCPPYSSEPREITCVVCTK